MLPAARLSCILLCALGIRVAAQTIWLDVPFVKQVENGCGAACVSMLMHYWHGNSPGAVAPDDAAIRERLRPRDRGGVRAAELERYLREQGYRVFAFAGRLEDLESHLLKGRPLIVGMKDPSGGAGFHFVVVAGLDRAQDLVLVNDPARRKLAKLRRADFEKDWKACGNWTLLAIPENER